MFWYGMSLLVGGFFCLGIYFWVKNSIDLNVNFRAYIALWGVAVLVSIICGIGASFTVPPLGYMLWPFIAIPFFFVWSLLFTAQVKPNSEFKSLNHD